MTDKPPAMPELPEPELGYIETDQSRQPAFSARQMREALRRVKYEAASLADAQVIALEALTQRPAAQTERGAFEAEMRCEETWGHRSLKKRPDGRYQNWQVDVMWEAWQARASLPAPQQATPEPVGEPSQFPPLPEGWPAHFRCDSCDGNGEIGELVSMGHFQPPERQTCPDCGGRGWTTEEPAFNADHMREFAEAHARNTRPAPGVPDGLEDQIMEALRDGLSVCMSVSVSRDRKISRDGCTLYAQTEEWCRWLDAEVGPKIRAAVDALAAAQAKK